LFGRLKTDKRGGDQQEARSACVGLACAGDDPAARFVAHGLLLDNEAWANSSSPLLANEEVRGAVSQSLVDRLFERVDVEAQLRARLPERSQGAAPVLAAAFETASVRSADRL
jgi:hypothetical protein